MREGRAEEKRGVGVRGCFLGEGSAGTDRRGGGVQEGGRGLG